MKKSFCFVALIGATGLLADGVAAEAADPAAEAARIAEAASALDRYCIGGLPDLEAIAIAMSADAGPETGRAYTPYLGPDGFIGASLRGPVGYNANASRKEDGGIVCGVALFTPMQGEFETAVLDRLVEGRGFAPSNPRRDADGGVTYALDRFATPATLSFRTRVNEAGEPAVGAVITLAAEGGALPEPLGIAAAPLQEPPQEPPAAPPVPPAKEPASPAEVATARPDPAPPVKPAPAATPAPAMEAAAAPAPLTPSKPAPSMPKAPNPPALADAPSLYEGAPYAAFTEAQIAEFCKQDWRTRRMAGGRTEYNPCFERRAFR